MLQATRSKTEGVTLHTVRLPTQRVTEKESAREQQEKGDDSLHLLSGFKVLMHLQQLLIQHARFQTDVSEGISALIQFISFFVNLPFSLIVELFLFRPVFETSCLRQVK